ncbi:MAG: hypothetical protein D6814_03375 [Calditrichaeota bacterium]|nr:MAG: hypothetical protein D6814_03375 [Calditrichota bacterium]
MDENRPELPNRKKNLQVLPGWEGGDAGNAKVLKKYANFMPVSLLLPHSPSLPCSAWERTISGEAPASPEKFEFPIFHR